MLSVRDHGGDHGLPGADRRLLRFGCESDLGAVEDCRRSSIALVSRGAAETAAWPRMRKRGGRVQPEPVRGLFVGG
jgi:hypothetical protein